MEDTRYNKAQQVPTWQMRDYAINVAEKNGMPVDMFLGLFRGESSWNPTAANPKSSARGLGQFIDGTAQSYFDDPISPKGQDPNDPRYSPWRSIDAAARYLVDLKTKHGTWEKAVYHYGERTEAYVNNIRKASQDEVREYQAKQMGEKEPGIYEEKPFTWVDEIAQFGKYWSSNIEAGWKSSVASFYNTLANLPHLLNKLKEVGYVGYGTPPAFPMIEGAPNPPNILKELEVEIRGIGAEISKDAKRKGTIDLGGEIIKGMGAAPMSIAMLAAPVKYLGSVGGFGALEAFRTADQGLIPSIEAAVKGAMVGMGFEGLAPLVYHQRLIGLGLLGAVQSALDGGGSKEITASAMVMIALGTMAGRGDKTARQMLGDAFDQFKVRYNQTKEVATEIDKRNFELQKPVEEGQPKPELINKKELEKFVETKYPEEIDKPPLWQVANEMINEKQLETTLKKAPEVPVAAEPLAKPVVAPKEPIKMYGFPGIDTEAISKKIKEIFRKPVAPRVATTNGAKEVEDMFDKADAMSHEAKKTTWDKFASKLITMTWDVSGNVKRALWREGGKEFGAEGKRVEIAMVTALGSSSRAALRQTKIKSVYEGLDIDRMALLDRVIVAKGAVIAPTSRHPELISTQKIPVEKYQEFLRDVANSDPEIIKLAEKYFELMRKNLKEGYDEGLITKKVYDELSKYDYAMRLFEQYIDPQGRYGFGQRITASDPGFKAIKKGSEGLLETDARLLASRAISTMQSRIMDNRAGKAAWAFTEKNPDNTIFRIAKREKIDPNEVNFSWEDAPPEYDMTEAPKKVIYKYEKLKPGEEYVRVRFDGKEKRLIVSSKYAQEWIKRDPAIRSDVAEIAGWLSGAKILRATATGYNPAFAARNMPRDMAHYWMVTGEYSVNPAKAAKQFAEDYKAVWSDAVHLTGSWVDYVNEGGGMEWLTAQGRLKNKYSGQLEGVQEYAGWIGQFSEIVTRLAVRRRAILNGRTPEEATYIARTALDFGQGGSFIKALDVGVPYLNAGVQATRTLFKAFTESPGKTLAKAPAWASAVVIHKMATLGVLAAGLYVANNYWNKEAYDQVPEEVKNNSFIITTPISYIDKNGDKRFVYGTIAKDQTQRLATTIFEGMAAKMMGHKFNWDRVIMAAKDLSFYIPSENVPPILSAFVGYATNKDFWRNSDIWRGPNVSPKEEFTPYTHPLAVKFGQATGLSPARMTFFFESFIASSNLFSNIVGASLRKIMETLPEKERNRSMAEIITGIPGLNSLIKHTDPMAQYRKPIGEMVLESTTKSYKQRREYDVLLEDFYAGKTKEKYDRIVNFVNKQPEEDRTKLDRHFKEYAAYRTIPDSRWWMALKNANPEVRAKVFYQRYIESKSDEKKVLRQKAVELPGIVTDKFNAEIDKIIAAQRQGATQ
jgi:hypothetical protein